jgi:hypothetical protein
MSVSGERATRDSWTILLSDVALRQSRNTTLSRELLILRMPL